MKSAASLLVIALTSPALLSETPPKTPTPAPRLSGGFGRPRSTAVPTPAVEGGGQSLADVVQAAHGAKEVAPPDKQNLTISNRSLVKSADKGRVSTSRPVPTPVRAAAPVPAPTAAPALAAASAPAGAAAAAGTEGTEAEWKETAAKARKRVADDKAKVAELQAATRKLENDFYAWDDGQYRDRVIKPSWDRSREDLETAKQELEAAEKDLADLPERARKAGAQPGWIRE